jgi:hypothetical protein
MRLCFVEQPRRYATIKIKTPIGDLDPKLVAMRELLAFTDHEVEQISAVATSIDEHLAFGYAPDLAAGVGGMLERRQREPRPPHMIYCPACCAKLGRADSAQLEFLDACHACRRRIRLHYVAGALTVVLWDGT